MAYPPIVGPPSGPKQAVLSYARQNGAKRLAEVEALVDELYVLAPKLSFDPFMIAVQSAHETGDPSDGRGWRSPIWETRLNPAGLGVTDGGDQGIAYQNGRDAARALLVHHAAYVFGRLPDPLKPYLSLDPRYQAVFAAGFAGTVTNWGDYGGGKWATDPNYASKLMAKADLIRSYASAPNGSEVNTMPNIYDWWLHEDRWVDGVFYPGVTRRYINRAGYHEKVIVLHIQEGVNLGSWQHFHSVKASSTVLIAKNGDIWRLVPESDGPWTNGDTCSATAKGREIMNAFGPDANYYSLTIETEGYWWEWPKPQAQLDAVVWQVKEWMKKYGIPKSRVIRHADINQCDRANCPGDAYYNYVMARLDDDTVAAPKYSAPQPIMVDGKKWDGTKDVTVGDVTFYGDIKEVTVGAKGAVCRQWATDDALKTRSDLKKGTTFNALGWVHGEKIDGESRWWVTKNWSRIHVGQTVTKPTEKKPRKKPENPYDREVDGVRFFATGKPVRVKVGDRPANVYASPTTTAKVKHTLKAGETFTAVYWVYGEGIDGENRWWVTVGNNRVHVGKTVQKPDAL